jgi:hypothetical protein
MWQPPVTGLYKVVASFEGSESYAPSIAETQFGVGVAPSAAPVSPAPTQTNGPISTPSFQPTASASATPTQAPSPNQSMPTTTYIAIAAVVIVIVVIVAAIALRKRK